MGAVSSTSTSSENALAGTQAQDIMVEQIKAELTVLPARSSHEQYPYASKPLYESLKRVFDIVASVVAIILLAPIMLIASLAIKIDDPKGNVLYCAPRGGKNGRPFVCYKFRSMHSNADEIKVTLMNCNEMSGPVFKVADDPRITTIGKIIRKTSIDELPQLFNTFLGHMSFVGPRPLPIEEAQAVPTRYKAREMVTPGITCIWQVSGRNTLDFDDWMRLDLEYLQKRSLWFDLKLLLKTIPAVLSARGAS